MKPVADVSIIAANYNNGIYLHTFIQSIIESTWLPKQLIVVDDGSTDDSMVILNGFKHLDFLQVIKFEKNQGFTAALNKGLESATGKYIMRADPDDILMPERIEKQVFFLEQHPEIDIIGSNALYFIDDPKNIHNKTNFPLQHKNILQTIIKGEHGVLHATVCGKSNVYKEYRYQKIYPGEDYELFARMARAGHIFANIPEPLYLIRVHSGSSTSNIKLEDIQQTFLFRDQIFGTKTGKLRIWLYFKHIYYYRKYQITQCFLKKNFYLILSTIAYPAKLFKRLFI
ncbi:MAG: glycosyltransferase [Bacteroidales bacterium]